MTISTTNPLDHSIASVPEEGAANHPYSFTTILGIWFLATLPMLLLTHLGPRLFVPLTDLPPVLVYWLMLLLGMTWQAGLSLWILRREGIRPRSPEFGKRLWLSTPHDPKTGRAKTRLYWRLVPSLLAVLVVLGLGVLLVPNLIMLGRFLPIPQIPYRLQAPSYTFVTELASAEFPGRSGW